MPQRLIRSLIVILLLIPSVLWAVPQTYYVKSGGNDSNTGLSDEQAWANIPGTTACSNVCASTTLNTGDTVYLRSQDTWLVGTSGATLDVLRISAGVTYDGSTYGSGTKATIQATASHNYGVVNIVAGGVTLRGLIIDGGGYDWHGIEVGVYAYADVSTFLIDNCIVRNIGATNDFQYGIAIGGTGYKVSNVTVTNTTVYNTAHEGIAVYPAWGVSGSSAENILIRGCTIYNASQKTTGMPGVEITNDVQNATVEFNNIYSNGIGLQLRTSSNNCGNVAYGPRNAIIRYNLIHDNLYDGMQIKNECDRTSSASIYSNIIWNSYYSGGVQCHDFYASGEVPPSPNTYNIYNNTIFDNLAACSSWRVALRLDADRPASTTIYNLKNNILNSTNAELIWDHVGTNTVHSYNLIYRSSGATDLHVRSPFASNTYDRNGGAADLTNWEATAKKTDPTFTGGSFPTGFSGTYGTSMVPNTTYFAITSGDALNNGATLGSPYNGCINGAGLSSPILRPQGAGYDIGAYEYVTAGSSPASFIGGSLTGGKIN